MADDSEVQNTKRRFSIIVPEPTTRLNFGQPDTWVTGPFGYTGASIHADDHVFVDAGGDALHQSGGGTHIQAGGALSEFASGAMTLSTDSAGHLSSADTLTIVAGAGQGDVGQPDHGDSPSLPSYNNLQLHYRVDEIQTGLFEFFHGRRERAVSVGPFPLKAWPGGIGGKKYVFDRSKAKEAETELELKGLVYSVEKSLLDLFPHATYESKALKGPVVAVPAVTDPTGKVITPAVLAAKADDPPGPAGRAGHPLKALEDLRAAVLGNHYPEALEYGYSDYLSRFDPYAKTDPSGLAGVKKFMAQLGNVLAVLNRFVDVIAKYGSLISDNFLVKRAVTAASALGGLFDMASAFTAVPSSIVNSVFNPMFLPEQFADDTSGVGSTAGDAADPMGGHSASDVQEKQAEIAGERGPFELADGDTFKVVSDEGTEIESTAVFGGPPRRAKVTTGPFTAPLAPLELVVVSVTVDGTAYECLIESSVTDAAALATTLGDAVNPANNEKLSKVAKVAKVSGVEQVEIENLRDLAMGSGEQASVAIAIGTVQAADAAAAVGRLGLANASDTVRAPNVQNIAAVTAQEVLSLLGAVPGVEASVVSGRIQLTATTKGAGSMVEGKAGSGSMAATLGLAQQDVVTAMESSEAAAGWENWQSQLGSLSSWAGSMAQLPSECESVTKPLIAEVDKVVAAVQSVADFVETAVQVITDLDGPPSAVGIFAGDGITLGTTDRLVGTGSKGIVFIADGGAPSPDHKKYVKTEDTVARILEWDPIQDAIDARSPASDDPAPPLGFRVLSDSVADLTARTAAQLMALGRAKAGTEHVGTGVARVAASHAAEVVGYKKVVISARGKDSKAPDDFTKMGRVEVAGQTIAIGASKIATQQLEDLKDPAAGEEQIRFGVHPATTATDKGIYGGHAGFDDKTGKWSKEKLPLAEHAWTAKLNTDHPPTQHVIVHADKQTTIVVGNYLVSVTADKGIMVGQRTKAADASLNQLDLKKPHFSVDETDVYLRVAEDGAHLHIADQLVEIFSKDGGNQVLIDGTKIAADVGGQTMTIDKMALALKHSGSSLKIGPAGIQIKGKLSMG
jgi:hypothetical protein